MLKKIACLFCLFLTAVALAQHRQQLWVTPDMQAHTLQVKQSVAFHNSSAGTLQRLVFNDWNNAYSDKQSLLGKRFSDEFVRSFHLAKDSERGGTEILKITDANGMGLSWSRPPQQIDLLDVQLPQPLPAGATVTLQLEYTVKLPSAAFTGYGYGDDDSLVLRDWFLAPARLENGTFLQYSNANLDDIANGVSDYSVDFTIPAGYEADTDLDQIAKTTEGALTHFLFEGTNRSSFSFYLSRKSNFELYKNDQVSVLTDLPSKKINDIQKAIMIDRLVRFATGRIGQYPNAKITVSQTDYERNPFYGLNQLPSFLSPFPEDFLFELRFLKTYTNNLLHNSLQLDPRRDNWIYDAIQLYVMTQYIDEFRPETKMMGSLSKWKILRSYNLINLQFNEQYSYYYMLMARKNLDQPLGDSKETLIRFNEKIASKYRAGLSLQYLDNYLTDSIVPQSIREFYTLATARKSDRHDFEQLLKSKTDYDIDWFFRIVIESREIIDYKFGKVSKTPESVTMTIKNRTSTEVPIPVYGLKDNQIVFKQWFEKVKDTATFTVPRNGADKIVLNYRNEVPEFNLRNNWRSLKVFFGNDRPYKFAFLKDLEDPAYNQIIYVPTLTYNLYDGLSPGIKLSNKTLLDKPVIFDVNPVYSPNTRQLTGSFSFGINQYRRESQLYNIRYGIGGSYYHYAPDAAYLKFNPTVSFAIREKELRDNKKQGISLRYNVVRKETSRFVIDSSANYSIFAARYSSARTTITDHLNYNTDVQLSSGFGKAGGELEFRKLFNSNRQFNIRFFAGTFLYNNTGSDYYNFGLDKPNDYLFEYNFFGRSESTGIFSQQLILAEGGFKSKLRPSQANQWLATTNLSVSIWNWIEAYGDAGFVKNHHRPETFVYDSGIRLNLVTDYFELYFPVYSNNGWEIAQPHYNEKIRFIATFSPKTLLNLFTRKWF